MRLKKTLIGLIMLFCLLGVFKMNTFATGSDIHGNDDGGTTDHIINGTSPLHSGWLVYCVDSNGQVSTSVLFYSADDSWEDAQYGDQYLKTRIGNVTYDKNILQPAPWGISAYSDNGNGNDGISNADAIRSWLLATDDGESTQRVFKLIDDLWGTDYGQTFYEKMHYFVLEPVFWFGLYNGTLDEYRDTGNYKYISSGDGQKIFCGTVYGIAQRLEMYNKFRSNGMSAYNGYTDTGNWVLNAYTNKYFPMSMFVENDYKNLRIKGAGVNYDH